MTTRAPTSAPTEDVRIITVKGDAVIGYHYGDLELETERGEKSMCDQADAWQRTHPGARDPVRRHLCSERPHNLAACYQARRRVARHEVVRQTQDRSSYASTCAATWREGTLARTLPRPRENSSRRCGRLCPAAPPLRSAPRAIPLPLLRPPPCRHTEVVGKTGDGAGKTGDGPRKLTRGAGLPGLSPVAATDFYRPSVQV